MTCVLVLATCAVGRPGLGLPDMRRQARREWMNGKGMGKVLRLIIDYLHKMRPKFNSNSACAKLSYAVIHPNYGHR